MSEWEILPGEHTTRQSVAAEYGGATQGGIQPSRQTPNVMIYSDPARGEQHGYTFDGFANDGAYYYTGEGQLGDQDPERSGNGAILRHATDGRTLRVFEASGYASGRTVRQRYVGAFAIDPERPFRYEPAPDRDGNSRRVVVFRLLPADAVAGTQHPRATAASSTPVVEVVAPEHNQEEHVQVSAVETREAQRWEARLMRILESHITKQGHDARRLRIRPPGESVSLLTDSYDATANELFEVKPTASRAHVRAAMAQLLDYRRFAPNGVRCTVAVPTLPSTDLQDYILSAGLEYAIIESHAITRPTRPLF